MTHTLSPPLPPTFRDLFIERLQRIFFTLLCALLTFGFFVWTDHIFSNFFEHDFELFSWMIVEFILTSCSFFFFALITLALFFTTLPPRKLNPVQARRALELARLHTVLDQYRIALSSMSREFNTDDLEIFETFHQHDQHRQYLESLQELRSLEPLLKTQPLV